MAAVKLTPTRDAYHANAGQGWRRARGIDGKAIGVEFEVEGRGAFATVIDALPMHDAEVDGPAPHFERDGTLNDVRGVEIIFPPYSPKSIRDGSSYLSRAITKLHADDVCNITAACGMHMNVNARGWSAHKMAVFCGIIHWMPPTTMERLGGRRPGRWCQQSRNTNLTFYSTQPGNAHSYATENKEGRVELRFPSASTDFTRLARLSLFIDMLEDYAQAMPVDFEVHPEDHYNNFLASAAASPDGDVNALAAFLAG